MLPQSPSNQSRRAFFNLSNYKTHIFYLPDASHPRPCGSSHRWLAVLDDTPTILLVIPLTRFNLHLSPLHSFPIVVSFDYSNIGREYLLQLPHGNLCTRSFRQMRNSFIRKVVLSSSSSQVSEFIALAILSYNGHLAFCRNGDQSWTSVDKAQNYCEDVVYHNGLFYAINKKGGVAVCENQGHLLPRVCIIDADTEGNDGEMQYLVFLGNELLLVTRYLEFGYRGIVDDLNLVYKTAGFAVSRMNWIELRWQKIETLGHQFLFIGENSPLSALDFLGCLGPIYFTDDYSGSNYDGVFENYEIEPLTPYLVIRGIHILDGVGRHQFGFHPIHADSGIRMDVLACCLS